jgi:2-oxo-3-hexenedioate decarboxylase
MPIDPGALADELADAYTKRRLVAVPPSGRDIGFDLDAAYAVEADLVRRRRAGGRTPAGLKVGYANKAMWRVFKLNTLVWAHMYDDTVHRAPDNEASLALAAMVSPKIEPEIVFAMRRPLEPGTSDPAAILDAVASLALGFEIIDCVYAGWTFQPADFVAAYGLHAALVVGEPLPVSASNIPALAEALPRFGVALSRDGALVGEGSGKNALRSPALCLGELVSAMADRSGSDPLGPGDLISSGTLTESQPIASGERWVARVEGLDLPPLTIGFE